MISFTSLICVLLTYLTESWISPDYSYEFNVVYAQREKLQYLLYYNNIWSADFQDEKQNKVTIKRHFIYHFIVYIYFS